ncbi:HNH endonuclease signature motif containing protein [Jiangella endophytica]|uniref:HNH endonuclease signature motif containing protein n=1 Tax=Jiangella endophytica TaxID=1623398 RepID=UPI0038CBF8A5
MDHVIPFAAGGTTCAANLHALCETHHLLKHHGRWTVCRQPDGTTVWAGPTGHRYLRPSARAG